MGGHVVACRSCDAPARLAGLARVLRRHIDLLRVSGSLCRA
ncbi:putative leader peptide [Streptomyces mayteni]